MNTLLMKEHGTSNIMSVILKLWEPPTLNSLDDVSTTTKSRWLPADGD
ncbi:hypothetical protein FOTG_01360 [Fusarium oxysporum f. sp. vasinfectum 25433]|uniref:Uncharacterized protein n=1 Tax=Fusarium oxysporum f. sp. vasinfectum 25433 TaxID=1089449 RepID=X0NPK9_FUSOX|nr:hypothetical protein FOTG_01360 [Fusarium oxysporum f. sp. vasinfectum 25433]